MTPAHPPDDRDHNPTRHPVDPSPAAHPENRPAAPHPDNRPTAPHPDNRPAAHRWPGNGSRNPQSGAATAGAATAGAAEQGSRAVMARFVVHLPLVAADLPAALRLARVLAHRAATLPGADCDGATVSRYGDQEVSHPVFCNRLLPHSRRCRLTSRHQGPCHPHPPT